MSNVNQVIELGSVADGSDSQRGAIDAGVGANLDIVADLDAADLRELLVTITGANEAEAVGAEHATGVQHGTVAEDHVIVNCNVRVENTIVADADARSDGTIGADAGAFANEGTWAHLSERTDGSGWLDARVFGDGRTGVNPGNHRGPGIQQPDHPGESTARIFHADYCAALREIVHDQKTSSLRIRGRGQRFAISNEGDLVRTGRFERGNARNFKASIAFPSRLQMTGNVSRPASPVSYKLMPVDPSARVAASARVHPDAQIGPQAVIGEYAIVEEETVIGAFCRLEPYVYVKRWTTMGERNEISAGTVLGSDPLDKNFRGERSYLRIGNGNVIREHYTVSRGTQPESVTEIGMETTS